MYVIVPNGYVYTYGNDIVIDLYDRLKESIW